MQSLARRPIWKKILEVESNEIEMYTMRRSPLWGRARILTCTDRQHDSQDEAH